jgi:hypothetical protein
MYSPLWWCPVDVVVSPGNIECSPGLGLKITHTNQLIWAVHSRLVPQATMLGDTIEIVGQRGYRAYLCSRRIGRLRAAFEDVGFVVRDRRIWTIPFGGPRWLPRSRS